jgi:hypothetical protein
MKYAVIAILLAAAPQGCDPNFSPAQRAALCQVLIGPIKYNTYNKNSHRYAADQLAPDLKQHNQVGTRLGCF